jgi:hypothetical protein
MPLPAVIPTVSLVSACACTGTANASGVDNRERLESSDMEEPRRIKTP